MTGFDVCEIIKTDDRTARLPVRAASGAGRIFGTTALVVVRTAEDGLVQVVGGQGGGATAVTDPPQRFAREVMRLQGRDDDGVRMETVPAGRLAGEDPLTGGARALAVASARVDGTGTAAGVVLPRDALSAHPASVRVPVGLRTQLVMVTDGLLEQRGGDLDEAMDRMAQVLTGAPQNVEAVCEPLLARFPPDGNDDIALLTARLL
jgi:stage II sporulation SpoE-like protein